MIALAEETERLVHRIAGKTGKAPNDVSRDAVIASAQRAGVANDDMLGPPAIDHCSVMIDAARAIAQRAAARPIIDPRTDDEILGTDSHGMPA